SSAEHPRSERQGPPGWVDWRRMGSSAERDESRLDRLSSGVSDEFDRVFRHVRRLAVVQYPADANVGNHMMFLGLERYIDEAGIELAYVSDTDHLTLGDLRLAVGRDPIVL